MKVRLNVTVEVDPKEWAQEYCMDPRDETGIRNDVQTYCENLISGSAAGQMRLLAVQS